MPVSDAFRSRREGKRRLRTFCGFAWRPQGTSGRRCVRDGLVRPGNEGAAPHTVVCQGARKTTRRYPRRFAEDFAASGLEVADLAAFAAAWRARVTAPTR